MSALFANNLSELFAEAEGKVMRRIAVDLIDYDPDQPRTEISEASIREMGETLANEGQLQAIVVIELPSGRYKLVIGERRVRGAKWKGLAELDAVLHPDGSDPKLIRRRQLIENLQREDMSALDTANAIARLVKDEGSAAAAARAIGKSEGQISKYLSVLKLPPVAAELAGTKVTRDVETLTTVAAIERADPAAAEGLVAEARTTGRLTRGRAREVAQAVNDALKSKKSTKGLIENKGPLVKPASSLANAPTKPASASDADAVSPVRLRAGEALAVVVTIADGHRDAKRFNKAEAVHGAAQLFQGGVSRSPDRVWVQFGETPKAKRDDVVPRLQEFSCSAIVLDTVTRFRPEPAQD